MTCHLLYNPLAANGNGLKTAQQKAERLFAGQSVRYEDVTAISDLKTFLETIPDADRVILAGGDGTINRFINALHGVVPNRRLEYLPVGTGNDFFQDVKEFTDGEIVELNPYLENLPSVCVNGEETFFLNGIGYGIDGYCCEEGDRLRTLSSKPVNYTAIAIKGLLYRFSPHNAVVTVDGVEYRYRYVWLAPTMNGRFYGGGMMVTPMQDRMNEERLLTVAVMHGSKKLQILTAFPKIFSGKHIKYTKLVSFYTGREISVRFDRPCALQIDGETVVGVTEYAVHSGASVEQSQIA